MLSNVDHRNYCSQLQKSYIPKSLILPNRPHICLVPFLRYLALTIPLLDNSRCRFELAVLFLRITYINAVAPCLASVVSVYVVYAHAYRQSVHICGGKSTNSNSRKYLLSCYISAAVLTAARQFFLSILMLPPITSLSCSIMSSTGKCSKLSSHSNSSGISGSAVFASTQIMR